MNIEDSVISYFKQFNINATKIPESDKRTADFLIEYEDRILIELKEKLDKPELYASRERAFEEDDVFENIQTSGSCKRISEVVRSGIDQLTKQMQQTNADFCFLFIVTAGVTPEIQKARALSTLYGRMSLINLDKSETKDCYYANYSEFYNYKNLINGVFLTYRNLVCLLLNDKSPTYEKLKSSKFFETLKEHMLINDPIEREKNGEIMIADCDIPRSNKGAVEAYVRQKYSIEKSMLVDFPYFTAEGRINLEH